MYYRHSKLSEYLKIYFNLPISYMHAKKEYLLKSKPGHLRGFISSNILFDFVNNNPFKNQLVYI